MIGHIGQADLLAGDTAGVGEQRAQAARVKILAMGQLGEKLAFGSIPARTQIRARDLIKKQTPAVQATGLNTNHHIGPLWLGIHHLNAFHSAMKNHFF